MHVVNHECTCNLQGKCKMISSDHRAAHHKIYASTATADCIIALCYALGRAVPCLSLALSLKILWMVTGFCLQVDKLNSEKLSNWTWFNLRSAWLQIQCSQNPTCSLELSQEEVRSQNSFCCTKPRSCEMALLSSPVSTGKQGLRIWPLERARKSCGS